MSAGERLGELRADIERLDRQIVALLAERMRVGREIGTLKQTLALPVLDPAREAAVVRRAGELARDAGVPAEDVRYIWWHIVGLSRRAQIEGQQ